MAYGTLQNETKRNGTLQNGTLQNNSLQNRTLRNGTIGKNIVKMLTGADNIDCKTGVSRPRFA